MNAASTTISSRLAEIAGPSNVVADPAQLGAYEICGKIPGAAARPGSSEEATEIVKFAAAEKLAIVPTGARTKLGMGLPPRQYDLALDMTRLDRVVAYDPGDLTLSVEPGTPLRRLEGVLAGHRQFLPLDVPFMNRATAGGTIASGVDSPLRQFYGTARDYVLGMEFVTGDGMAAKSGGRVVKNVAGYDLHKVMIGALGTLSVITKINFRTFPLPGAMRTFVAGFSSAERALDLRHRVARSPLRPLTAEILSPRAAELLSSAVAAQIEPGPMPPGALSKEQWAVMASFGGTGKVLERSELELRRMAEDAGAAGIIALGDDRVPFAFGRTREFVPIALESSAAATILKLGVLPTRMRQVLDAAAKAADAAELRWAALVRGLGVIYLALLPSEENQEALGRVVRAANDILAECAALGGNAAIPWCPAAWKSLLPVWGLDRGDFEQMRKLKKVFDPHGILAPGRFAGGI
ncbi:MAG: FAD-binding oxidoreductase [Candidatus Acidiferrales bacterium]|jgi:glycolate oxidase FAD binding subunit